MPLQKGYSAKTRSGNIGEMIDTYKSTGKIGSTTPRNMAHAQSIASARAYSKARKSASGKKKTAIIHSLMPRKKY